MMRTTVRKDVKKMKKLNRFLLGLMIPFAAVLIAPFMAIHDLAQNLNDLL